MVQKLAILSGLIISATCAVLPQAHIPIVIGLQQYHEPNYNFAYEVNSPATGDVKSQHESRRGDTVLGQYSLIQPDGVRRTVDYRADDHTGFQATVSNDGRQVHPQDNVNVNAASYVNAAVYGIAHIVPTPAPVAISSSSIVHSVPSSHNPWY